MHISRLRCHEASGILDVHGAVAQLGEHLNGIEGVKGSNPFSSTIIIFPHQKIATFFEVSIAPFSQDKEE